MLISKGHRLNFYDLYFGNRGVDSDNCHVAANSTRRDRQNSDHRGSDEGTYLACYRLQSWLIHSDWIFSYLESERGIRNGL